MGSFAGLARRSAGGAAAEPPVALRRVQPERHVLAPGPIRYRSHASAPRLGSPPAHLHQVPLVGAATCIPPAARSVAGTVRLAAAACASPCLDSQAPARGTSCSAAASVGCSSRPIRIGHTCACPTRRRVRPALVCIMAVVASSLGAVRRCLTALSTRGHSPHSLVLCSTKTLQARLRGFTSSTRRWSAR